MHHKIRTDVKLLPLKNVKKKFQLKSVSICHVVWWFFITLFDERKYQNEDSRFWINLNIMQSFHKELDEGHGFKIIQNELILCCEFR